LNCKYVYDEAFSSNQEKNFQKQRRDSISIFQLLTGHCKQSPFYAWTSSPLIYANIVTP